MTIIARNGVASLLTCTAQVRRGLEAEVVLWRCSRRRLSLVTTRPPLDGIRVRPSGSDCRWQHADFRRPTGLSSVRRRRRRKLQGTAACPVLGHPVSRWTTAVLPLHPSLTVLVQSLLPMFYRPLANDNEITDEYDNGYRGVRGWWLNVSNVLVLLSY